MENNSKTTNSTDKNSRALVFALVTLCIFVIAVCIFGGIVKQVALEQTAEKEEFYNPYWINDSTMHMNISEGSCILVQFVGDECYVTANNIEYVNFSDGILKIMYHENKEFKATEFNLDSITNRDCSNIVF